MPKRNMAQASLDNLKPCTKGCRTEEEQKIFATKGGIASGKARSAREAARRLLEQSLTQRQIKEYEQMGNSYDGTQTGIDLLMAGQARAAMLGSEKCARLILEYAGEVAKENNTDAIDLLETIKKSIEIARGEQDDSESETD